MADANSITKKLSNSDRLNEASLLLYRAIAVNDLIYEAACNDHTSISEKTLWGYRRFMLLVKRCQRSN